MESYAIFAEIYDELMDNIPYKEWVSYLTGLLKERGVNKGLVCELGCGTGTATELLLKSGYDMIGIDNSEEMLAVARDKQYDRMVSEESGDQILYLHQDMREFELYGTVDAFVSICDSMNYILRYDDLVKVFKCVNNYLEKDGLFVFDLKTKHYFKDVLGDGTIAENREDCSFIWENAYDENSCINQYYLTMYIEEEDEKYGRYEEIHQQKAYDLEEIKKAIEEAGMVFECAYDAFTKEPANKDSERIYIVAREGFQENKKYI
ncbi:MAG: class I SAM-dependent methyltransferase [Lachnospiraceae bacterium]|nr:class I SAM-dependent methyltransferase [Lachnospiraceae bacterium]